MGVDRGPGGKDVTGGGMRVGLAGLGDGGIGSEGGDGPWGRGQLLTVDGVLGKGCRD